MQKNNNIITSSTTQPAKTIISPTPVVTQNESHLIINKPLLDLSLAKIATDDGNVYLVLGNQRQLLIDKKVNNHYYYGQAQQIAFPTAQISPDKTKLFVCIEGLVSSSILVYVDFSNITQSQEISSCYEPTWSPDSRHIASFSSPGDCGPQQVNLVVYDTKLNKKSWLTNWSHPPAIQNLTFDLITYDHIQWLNDSSGITSHYDAYAGSAGCDVMGKKVGQGTLTLSLSKSFQP